MARIETITTLDQARRLFNELKTISNTKIDKVQYKEEENSLVFKSGDTQIAEIKGIGGGGGGSSSILKATTSSSLTQIIADGDTCVLDFTWSSTVEGESTGPGTATIKVNGLTKNTLNIEQGSFSVDVSEWVTVGTIPVTVIITDSYSSTRTFTFSILCESLSISSDFNDKSRVFDGPINYTYIPSSTREKTIHFELDGTELDTYQTSENTVQSITLPAQTHGVHTFRVWFMANVNGTMVRSKNTLEYKLICIESGNTTPIVAFYLFEDTLKQYYTYPIKYKVWTSEANPTVTLNDGSMSLDVVIDSSAQTWSYRPTVKGSRTLSVTYNSTTVEKTVNVVETEVDIRENTTNLELKLSSENRSNGEANPLVWSYGKYSCQFSDFALGETDGWYTDKSTGLVSMRLKDKAKIVIPYHPFEADIRNTGFTFEVEFSTSDVSDYNSSIISCLSGNKGINITAQNMAIQWGAGEQNTLYSQYKENEHMRVSFVVTTENEANENYNLVYIYLNGILTRAICYKSGNFQQLPASDIILYSPNCTTDIYMIRAYSRALGRSEILKNWLIDMRDGDKLSEEYVRNKICSGNDGFTGNIVATELPNDLPYLVISGDLPVNKEDELYVSGYYRDNSDETKNFTFDSAEIKVQGTSSLEYPRKNYKIKFPTEHSINNGPYSKKFTFKADYASSEGANNVELVRLYEDIITEYNANDECIFRTPPQRIEGSNKRQGIDGFPIAVFHEENNQLIFIGKYNWNYDKGTEEVYGFEAGDESWETRINGGDWARFKTADYSGEGWKTNFEGRYPDKNTDATNLAALASWLVSTDRTQATDNPITPIVINGVTYSTDSKEYRLAKFKNEFISYFDLDDTLFYYVFTEMFLMIDSRVKNSFPTKWADDGKWSWLPYDMDTALGINNEGLLVFDYNLEDTDEGVYNGEDSVIWTNFRDAFPDEIKAMYLSLRSGENSKFNYDYVEKRFEEHQSHWPATVWNEDAYYKYIIPWVEDNKANLFMCQGSKSDQRKWWLYNRFRYIDSKYETGLAKSEMISFRSYALGDGVFEITPYADIYARVMLGQIFAKAKAKRNETTSLTISGVTPHETETEIYSADQLAYIGDLSKFNIDYIDLSHAIRLQALKVGDKDKTNGELYALKKLDISSNILLKSIDARNCINLSGEVNASNCGSLKEAYFGGTQISYLNVPDSGILEILQLPNTIEYLKIKDHKRLVSFEMPSYENIERLYITNPSDEVSSLLPNIVSTMVSNGGVRLENFTINAKSQDEVERFIAGIKGKSGLNDNGSINTGTPAQLSGVIKIYSLGESLYNDIYDNYYPNVRVEVTEILPDVTFRNYDNSLLATVTFTPGQAVSYPDSTNPKRPATSQKYYTFNGWVDSDGNTVDLSSIVESTTVYASYTESTRYYVVMFMNNSSGTPVKLQENMVEYGGSVTYSGTTPTYNGSDSYAWGAFKGWEPPPNNITQNTYCIATFESAPLARNLLSDDLVEVEDSVITEIGEEAFRSKSSLKTVSFPNVATINDNAFRDSGIATASFQNVETIKYGAFYSCGWLTNITIGNKLESLGNYVFEYCTKLNSINLPSTLKTIGKEIFWGCSSLSSVTLEEGIETIGEQMFFNCTALNAIVIPNSVTSIESWAFYGCSSLSSVTIGSGLETINGSSPNDDISSGTKSCNAWVYCGAITNFTVDPNNQYFSGENGALFNKNKTKLLAIPGVTEYTPPSSVTEISNRAGYGNKTLTKLIIPSSVKTIGAEVLTYSNATSVKIPKTVETIAPSVWNNADKIVELSFDDDATEIQDNAAYGAKSVATITIPNSVTKIGNNAFMYCSSLNGITIPNGVTSIGKNAFNGCSSLTEINIPDGITTISEYMFYSCSSLQSVTIPDSVTSIERDAFQYCSSLAEINIPDGITIIDVGTFGGCSALQTITIPSSVTRIDYQAFSGCSSMTSMIMKSETPPSLYNSNSLPSSIGMKIYVPYSEDHSILNRYKSYGYWSDFASRIEESPNG